MIIDVSYFGSKGILAMSQNTFIFCESFKTPGNVCFKAFLFVRDCDLGMPNCHFFLSASAVYVIKFS